MAAMLLVAGAASGPVLCQDESDIPTARQVVDRYVEAVGGEEAIRAHNVTVMEGSMEVASQGMSAELKIMAMAPDKMKMELNVPGLGAMQSGFDGEVGWTMNPMTGPMIQEGKELAQAKRQADFFSVFHGETLYTSMTNTGQVDFEGNACWKLELTTLEGDVITEFVNIETGLVDGMTMTQESQMGPITITSVIGEYKEFDGIMVPTKITMKIGPGMEQVLLINSVKFDGVTEADFVLPAEIQVLVGGGEAESGTEAETEAETETEMPVPAAPEDVKREE
jgi:hypothetical protein